MTSRLARVADEGRTLVLDGDGEEEDYGLSYRDISCVLGQLDVPERVIELMESTRALDGRQSDSWDGIEASWTYHPDDGLDIVLSLRD